VCPQIQAISDGGMLLMGHIGLTPQSSGQQREFKAQGRTTKAAKGVIKETGAPTLRLGAWIHALRRIEKTMKLRGSV